MSYLGFLEQFPNPLGKIVEKNTAQGIYEAPQHEYTKKLLSAIPHEVPKALLGAN